MVCMTPQAHRLLMEGQYSLGAWRLCLGTLPFHRTSSKRGKGELAKYLSRKVSSSFVKAGTKALVISSPGVGKLTQDSLLVWWLMKYIMSLDAKYDKKFAKMQRKTRHSKITGNTPLHKLKMIMETIYVDPNSELLFLISFGLLNTPLKTFCYSFILSAKITCYFCQS